MNRRHWVLALNLLATACHDETIGTMSDLTSIELTIVYDPELTLDQLRITSASDDGTGGHTTLVPAEPAPLAASQESVVLLYPDEAAGSAVELRVDGLSQGQMRASGLGETTLALQEMGLLTLTLDAPAICGDGVTRAGIETCDDGNTAATDGCDSACRIESGWNCEGEPSTCSHCGNGVCDAGEDSCSCAEDCGGGFCGDFVCCAATGETTVSCAADCAQLSSCGNATCQRAKENSCTCPQDCGSSCGDGCCNMLESAVTCAVDCP